MRAAIVLAALTGCLADLGPDVGAQQDNAACVNADSDPATTISFERDIHQGIMMDPAIHCVKCHTPGGATPIGLQIGGLDMSSYATFIKGGVHSATTIAIPGDPCDSIIVQKIGAAPPFGARMPKDGPPYLTAQQAQVIADWIFEGAHDN
ncbi:MAG: hypothetical protein QM831_35075 [Kofleriaceae bacterium]